MAQITGFLRLLHLSELVLVGLATLLIDVKHFLPMSSSSYTTDDASMRELRSMP